VIVLDASVVLEVLLRLPTGVTLERRLFDSNETLHAPHLLDVEVAQVLRRYALGREVDAERCRALGISAYLVKPVSQSELFDAIALALVYLGVARKYEPLLLLPIGMGVLLANLPSTGMTDEGGILWVLTKAGLGKF